MGRNDTWEQPPDKKKYITCLYWSSDVSYFFYLKFVYQYKPKTEQPIGRS